MEEHPTGRSRLPHHGQQTRGAARSRHLVRRPNPEKCVWIVKHQLPGRVRIYGDALSGDYRLAHGIRGALQKLDGVKLIRPNAASGACLILYDENKQSVDTLIDAIRHAHRSHNKWEDTLEAREVEAIHSVVETLAHLDYKIRQSTGGRVTLREVALSIMTGKAIFHILGSGLLTLAALESVTEVFLAWILFKHHRLERELEKFESFVHPGI